MTCAALVSSFAAATAGGVAAQTAPSTTSSSAPPASPTTSPDPGAAVPVDGSAPVDPTAPTTTAADPLAASPEALSGGAYGGQPLFDPGSKAVLGAELGAARGRLKDAQARYDEVNAQLAAVGADLARLAGRIGEIGSEREDRVADASAAKSSLQRRAVAAYVRGDEASTALLFTFGDPADYSRARQYLAVLAGQDRDAYDEYQRRIAGLDDDERRIVDEQAQVQSNVAALQSERSVALADLLAAQRCVSAYAAGSHVCPANFVFPVLGEVTFADTWGAPRLPGTADQHWHEGTDVMAPEGREVVAVEDGTLSQVGSAGLGGLRLWLHGVSGNDYYYAHFSGFAPGMADGVTVTAGTVVGYVGSTGDAAGGPSHLHFEIHPAGGRPVDSAPLLFATRGKRPMMPQSAVMERIPSVVGTLPPEER